MEGCGRCTPGQIAGAEGAEGEGKDEFALLDEDAPKMPEGKPVVLACTPCQRSPLSQARLLTLSQTACSVRVLARFGTSTIRY